MMKVHVSYTSDNVRLVYIIFTISAIFLDCFPFLSAATLQQWQRFLLLYYSAPTTTVITVSQYLFLLNMISFRVSHIGRKFKGNLVSEVKVIRCSHNQQTYCTIRFSRYYSLFNVSLQKIEVFQPRNRRPFNHLQKRLSILQHYN